MPLVVNVAKSSFTVSGEDWEPVNDIWWPTASTARRGEYWSYLATRLRLAKDSELRRGLDAAGNKLARIRYKRPDGATGPPLTPHRADSRFRRYARVVATRRGCTLFWGQGWAKVVGGHRSGRACGTERDVIGLSVASQRRVKAEARKWWRDKHAITPLAMRPSVPPRVSAPGVTVGAVEARLGFRFARPEGRRLVVVDAARLDRALAEDAAYFVGPLGVGPSAKPGAYRNAAEFIARARREGIAVEAPTAGLGTDGKPFIDDGRHRWAVLRDEGHALLVVAVPRGRAAAFVRRFGPASRPRPVVIPRAARPLAARYPHLVPYLRPPTFTPRASRRP